MAGTYLPRASALLATAVVAILAATSAVTVAAAAADKYSGRMVIIRAPGARVVSTGGSALSKWQQRRRRLVEDEVAPEFGGGHRLGADSLNYKGLDPNKQVCLKDHGCAAPGEPYIGRSCESKYGCPKKPTAWHARAVHV